MAMNFLQVLQGLGGSGIADNGYGNFGGPQLPAPIAAPMPAAAAPTPAPAPARTPRERSSVLDMIGRAADVFAKVGGAEALYQPTLDGREDRTRAIDLEALRKSLIQQQIDSGEFEQSGAQNARIGQALRGALALGADRGPAAFGAFAQQLGIPPERVAQISEALAQDPSSLTGLDRAFNGESNDFGLQPFYGKNAAGELEAYQLGKNGQLRKVALPEGVTPTDPGKAINLGGETAIMGTRSGKIDRVLPNTERPGGAEGRASRERMNDADNRTKITVAGMPARAGAGKAGGKAPPPSPAAIAQAARPLVRDLADAVKRLHESGGMTDGKTGTVGTVNAMARENVPGYERLTNSAGFSARQDLDRLTTQGISALLPLMGGLTLGGKNMDAAKELDTWKKAILSAKDYPSALRAIGSFQARIKQMEGAKPAAKPAARPAAKPAPRASGVKVSNW